MEHTAHYTAEISILIINFCLLCSKIKYDIFFKCKYLIKKGKVLFYGQEPPSGESTTAECGVNYQLLAVIY